MQKILKEFYSASTSQKVKDFVTKRGKNTGYFALASFALFLLFKSLKKSKERSHWNLICLKKKKQVDDQITDFIHQHLNNFQLGETLKVTIINSSIKELKQLIFDGIVTIKQVLLTYIERAVKYGTVNNWLADVCFEDALILASQQDLLVQQDKNILFAVGQDLFGIPVTVKDLFDMKGYDSTYGLASRCFKPFGYDGNQIHMIKQAGGIIFAKTNTPQIGLSFETNNYIFGRAKNPFNSQYTTGGSTGGEGGMLSKKCSLIGVGTDIGGSIRIPASFNGICGYKPSTKRICIGGVKKLHIGYLGGRNMVTSNGPMARNVDDMAIMMKVLLDSKVYDNAPVIAKDLYYRPTEWDQQLYMSRPKLTIGYFKSFKCLPSCAANQRAIDLAIIALQKQGHTLVPIELNDKLCEDALQLALTFFMADGLQLPGLVLDGERHVPEYNNLMMLKQIPKPLLKLIHCILKMLGQNRLAFTLKPALTRMSAFDLLCASGKQVELQKSMNLLWDTYQVDAIITPLSAGVALKHGQSRECFMTLIYAMIWNFFDYGAGVVPITSVQENEQHYDSNNTFSNPDPCVSALRDSLSTAKGLPTSVQVITRPLCDELCLLIMKQLQDEIKFVADIPIC